jgi:hypothetical protein
MNGICVVVAKLLNDLLDPLEIFVCDKISNGTLKAGGKVRDFRQRPGLLSYSKAPTFRLS